MLANSLKEFHKLCGTFPVKQEYIIGAGKVKKIGWVGINVSANSCFDTKYFLNKIIFSNTLLHNRGNYRFFFATFIFAS